jgi:hypothetical protein
MMSILHNPKVQYAMPCDCCHACGSKESFEWRYGPNEWRNLCNRCGHGTYVPSLFRIACLSIIWVLEYTRLVCQRDKKMQAPPDCTETDAPPPLDITPIRKEAQRKLRLAGMASYHDFDPNKGRINANNRIIGSARQPAAQVPSVSMCSYYKPMLGFSTHGGSAWPLSSGNMVVMVVMNRDGGAQEVSRVCEEVRAALLSTL